MQHLQPTAHVIRIHFSRDIPFFTFVGSRGFEEVEEFTFFSIYVCKVEKDIKTGKKKFQIR